MMQKHYQGFPGEAAHDAAAALSKNELASLYALLAYTAYNHKMSEDFVREIFANRFGIKDVAQLPRHSYDDAIRFLVDIQIDMLLN